MEPIIIFKATGEIRCPKQGEWIKDDDDFHLSQVDHWIDTYPIYDRIEIAVPEGARGFWPTWKMSHTEIQRGDDFIELKKPKVKKAIWERDWSGEHLTPTVIRTKYPITEEESRKLWNGQWHKVEGSEIEEGKKREK